MILRRSPESTTLVTYDGYVNPALAMPAPWRILWHDGPQGWHPGDHLTDDEVLGWTDLADRARPPTPDPALARLGSENLRLRTELKRAGKAYGRASQTIGYLRRELALARLYRTCWAKAQASDCGACREVFADTPFYSRTPTAEELAAVRRTPRSVGMGKNGPADLSEREGFSARTPRSVRAMIMEYFGPVARALAAERAFAEAVGDDREADAVMAAELADDERPVCAAAYTGSGRDTGHALCGSASDPVATDEGRVTCRDCTDILEEEG